MENRGTLSSLEVYERKMAWYAEDGGKESLAELVEILEAAGRGEIVCARGPQALEEGVMAMRVPARPRRMASASLRRPIPAIPPVRSTKSAAAATLGPMEPSGKE